MLHPYSIFFKAMWETPTAAHDDGDALPERTRRLRWRRWSLAARRRAAADRATDRTTAPPLTPTPAETPRRGVAG